jgi:biotin transport system ATP-binding protein
MNLIEFRGVSHVFSDGTTGLDRVNLRIEPGEFVLVAGRNGSGKTLLTRHMNGLMAPTSGEVLVDGVPVNKDTLRARTIVGTVFQDSDAQIVGETVFEDAAFGPRNLGLPEQNVRTLVRRWLRRMGLLERAESPPHLLSGGEKRRLSMASVLTMEPRALVLDEPLEALDFPGALAVLRAILGLHAEGRTLVVVTHDLGQIAAHATRVIIMEGGGIARDGEPRALLSELEAFGVRRPPRGDPLTWLADERKGD